MGPEMNIHEAPRQPALMTQIVDDNSHLDFVIN